MTQVKNNIYLF